MRRIGSVLMIAAAGSLAAGSTLAQVSNPNEPEILSSEEGALLPPEEWECSLYVEEYEDFLEAGNPPESWRFVGKRYRTAGDSRAYDWREWLEWYEDADCVIMGGTVGPASTAGGGGASGGVPAGGGLFGGDMTAVGIVGGLVVTGLIAAGGGDDGGSGRNKSPG